MCGRFASAKHDVDLVPELGVDRVVDDPPPLSWNVAPTQDVRVVVERRSGDGAGTERQLRSMRWGLIPSWATDPRVGSRMINARVETLSERPAYRNALLRRRCIVPATGYYEWWRQPDGTTIPQFLHRDEDVLSFAGLYEIWRDATIDDLVWTFTLLTTKAPDELGHIHDRSPVLIPVHLRSEWLDPHPLDPAESRHLLHRLEPPALAVRTVSTAVNNHRNNGPQLAEPIG